MTVVPTTPALRLSPAAAERFRACPKSYWFQDIERLPREERPSPILAKANAVHDALKLFYSIAPDDRSQQTIVAALRTVWRRHAKPGAFGNKAEEAGHGRDAVAMLLRYFEDFDTASIPLGLEDWVSVRLGDTEFFGKVDRVERRRSGDGLDIVDYKTGRKTLEPEDLPQESAAQIYLLGTEATFKEPVVRVRFIYLLTGEEVGWSPEPDEVELARTRLTRLATEIQSTETFEAFPGSQCRFCPFAVRCPERHRVPVDALVGDESLPF